MALIDEIGNKIASAGQKTAKVFSDMSQLSKLKDTINEEQKKINQYHTAIGKVYFERYGAVTNEDPFRSISDQILESQKKIFQLEEEIKRVQDAKTCPQCGATCPYGSLFCPSCGNSFPKEQARSMPVETAFKFCPECGASLIEGAVFCSECGLPIAVAPLSMTPPEVHTFIEPAPVYVSAPAPSQNISEYSEPSGYLQTNTGLEKRLFCDNCGADLVEDAVFCIECGQVVERPEATVMPGDFPDMATETLTYEFSDKDEQITDNLHDELEMEQQIQEASEPVIADLEKVQETSIENEFAELDKRLLQPNPEMLFEDTKASEEEEEEEAEAMSFCPDCGEELVPDAEFCINCGKRINA